MPISEIELIPHRNPFLRYISGTWFYYQEPGHAKRMLTNHEFFLGRFAGNREEALQNTGIKIEALRIYYTDKWMFDSDDDETRLYMMYCENPNWDNFDTELREFLTEPALPFRFTYMWVDLAFWIVVFYLFMLCMAVPAVQIMDDLMLTASYMYQKRSKKKGG